MSILSATLVNRVTKLLELNNDSNTVDKFQIYENLNAAQNLIAQEFPQWAVQNLYSTDFINLSNGTRDYSLASPKPLKILNIEVNYQRPLSSDYNKGHEARIFWGHFSNPYKTNIYNKPTKISPVIYFHQNVLRLYPIPDKDVIDGILFNYIKEPVVISDTQDCELEGFLEEALVFKAVALSALVDDYNLQLSQKFDDLYKDQKTEFLKGNFYGQLRTSLRGQIEASEIQRK